MYISLKLALYSILLIQNLFYLVVDPASRVPKHLKYNLPNNRLKA